MDERLTQLRQGEFGRLDATGNAYLDYTGSGLYAESQVLRHAEMLRRNVLGNPHSDTPASRSATRRVESVRRRVLEFFDADPADYEIVFTANATGALKLVGESFPFGPGSRYVLSVDDHNSVNGIRSFAVEHGAEVVLVPLNGELRSVPVEPYLAQTSAPSLFAYPAQSNFSGVKHPLRWVTQARAAGYTVLLDAAAYVATSALSLRQVPADFVAISFYKMFGYPTGLGALLARREALAALRRPWFAGGTVDYVSVLNRIHRLKEGPESLEDGTVDFLAIPAVPLGLELLDRVGMAAINDHVTTLAARLLDRMLALRHSSGQPMVEVYGPKDTVARGATVAFNLLDPEGRVIDFEQVEAIAGERGVSVRGGCFCNPGASETAFGYDAATMRRCLEALPPGPMDRAAFSACMGGRPAGAVRASLGLPSNESDVDRLLDALVTFRDRSAAG